MFKFRKPKKADYQQEQKKLDDLTKQLIESTKIQIEEYRRETK